MVLGFCRVIEISRHTSEQQVSVSLLTNDTIVVFQYDDNEDEDQKDMKEDEKDEEGGTRGK